MEQAGLGVELSHGSTIGGMLYFADDFVGVSDSEEELQRLINVAHAYCCNVSRSGFCQGVRVNDRFSATMCSDAFSLRYVGA